MFRTTMRLFAALLAVTFLALTTVPAHALPPDGPGPETPGTSSRVWPTTVGPGGIINFEVAGFPANEVVYIKIDDGTMCSDSSHGACVYHTQKLNSKGYAKGSFKLPTSLGTGKHWLRMLATGDVFDASGKKLGYDGYTRRGGNDFTIVKGGTTDGSGGSAAAAPGAASQSDGSTTGGSITLDAGDDKKDENTDADTDEDSTEATEEEATVSDDETTQAAMIVPHDDGGLPVVGIAILAGAVAIGAAVVAWALLGRRRGSGAT